MASDQIQKESLFVRHFIYLMARGGPPLRATLLMTVPLAIRSADCGQVLKNDLILTVIVLHRSEPFLPFARLLRFRHHYPARFTIICSQFGKAAEFGDGARNAHKTTATRARWC
jgi:hypothetical protein